MPSIIPINPMAAHIGGGVVQIKTSHDQFASGSFSKYEVVTSDTLSGVYRGFSNRFFSEDIGYLHGFHPSSDSFLRIRSISTTNQPTAWVQVRAATITKPLVLMNCKGIKGSVILEDSIFATQIGPKLLGFQANQDIIMSD